MECLPQTLSFDIFMNNHSKFSICLPTLELTTFEQQVWLAKIDNTMHYHWEKLQQKRNVNNLNSPHQAKKQ